MKTQMIFAALGMTLALPLPALAADGQQSGSGHYEWREVPQFGPRATGPARKRVWVPDSAQVANCDCAMMHGSAEQAADCMKMGKSAS